LTKVRLISYSQPVQSAATIIGVEDAQDLIAYTARVSNPSNQHNKKTSERLLSYLAKENHWSPFEMVSACIEIETTRDIARQILRHRSFSFQEFSQRYADPLEDLKMVKREARLQDHKNRQNSIEIENDPGLIENVKHQDLIANWTRKQSAVIAQAESAYKWAVDNGIAKEQARAVLPEGNTMSRIYMNGTIRSWMHYIELRSGNGTQKEHRKVAIACAEELETVFPIMNKFIKK